MSGPSAGVVKQLISQDVPRRTSSRLIFGAGEACENHVIADWLAPGSLSCQVAARYPARGPPANSDSGATARKPVPDQPT